MAVISAGIERETAGGASSARTTTEASWSGTIHDLRLPTRANEKRSTAGAQRNFSAHGTTSSDDKPIWPSENPCLRRITGSACVKKPKGSPCEKYKQPSRPSLVGVDSLAMFVAAFMSAPSCW